MDDALLIARARRGDGGAFGELYRKYRGLARLAVGGQPEADEILQLAWVRVWRSLHMYDAAKGNIRQFIRVNVRNATVDHFRRSKRQPLMFAELLTTDHRAEPPDRGLVMREEVGRVQARIAGLPENQRSLINLVARGATTLGCAFTEGIPTGTVKSRIHKARRRLAG